MSVQRTILLIDENVKNLSKKARKKNITINKLINEIIKKYFNNNKKEVKKNV